MKRYILQKEKEPLLIGIELEAESPSRGNGQGQANEDAERAIKLISDASGVEVEFGRDGGGVENAFSPMSFKWIQKNRLYFQQVLQHYKNAGFKGDESVYAGIHIHIDRQVFDKENFIDFIDFLRNNKEFLHDLSNRRNRREYTNVDTTNGKSNYSFSEVNKEQYGKMFETWRTPTAASVDNDFNEPTGRAISARGEVEYIGNNCLTLNGNGKGTIECRFFNSTLDINRFMANISFIHALVFFIKSGREKTLKGFIKYCDDYRFKYLDFVDFYLVPKKHLEAKEVSESRQVVRTKKVGRPKKKTNVQFV